MRGGGLLGILVRGWGPKQLTGDPSEGLGPQAAHWRRVGDTVYGNVAVDPTQLPRGERTQG